METEFEFRQLDFFKEGETYEFMNSMLQVFESKARFTHDNSGSVTQAWLTSTHGVTHKATTVPVRKAITIKTKNEL